ncbi:hypothetical protein DRF65_10420 [Chryseobacterium pennae]|uniref:Uncharacterized protein n=1 Tax=Chryseobacterium pennae TaxID=2258962 RepID=A0A3D9C9X0_9FLAO|nr:hypothetical protein [Chryseobacterium pennae]REC62498.1 hypothetical protein DRF65_10420 [Chryseobacterium pennae]
MYKLTDHVDIEIIAGQQLSAIPRMLIYDVEIVLTTANSIKEMDHEILTTYGSDKGWLFTENNDTFRFDTSDHLLTSIYFDYSEQEKEPDHKLDLIMNAKKIVGIPKLVQPSSFDLEPFEYRYCVPSSNILLGYGDIFLKSQNQCTELQITENISLLFNENHLYCAWLMKHPEQFLVNKIAPIEKYPVTPLLKKSFWDVFQFINQEKISLMEEEDIPTFHELLSLYKNIHSTSENNNGMKTLAEKLFNVADNFYSQEQMKFFH